MRRALKAWKLMSGPRATGQRKKGVSRARAAPPTTLPGVSGPRVSDPSSGLSALGGGFPGLVGSLLGMGGGAFLAPLLALFFGIPLGAAIAARLISVIATASASATVNLDRGLVNLRLGLVLEVATSVGGLAGGVLASRLSPRPLFLAFAPTPPLLSVLVRPPSNPRTHTL